MLAPLIHIPDKAILNTYYMNNNLQQKNEAVAGEEFSDNKEEENIKKAPGQDRDKNTAKKFKPSIGNIKTGEQLVYKQRNLTMIWQYTPGCWNTEVKVAVLFSMF